MKTVFDLPDGLLKQVESRASDEGRVLSDVAADLLRMGLASGSAHSADSAAGDSSAVSKTLPVMKIDPLTKLPYFECAPDAPASRMTAEQLIALEQVTQTEEDLERLGLSPRQ